MHYKYISSSLGQKSTYISQEDFPKDVKWTRCYYPNEKWYSVLQIKSTYPASCVTPTLINNRLMLFGCARSVSDRKPLSILLVFYTHKICKIENAHPNNECWFHSSSNHARFMIYLRLLCF